MNNRRTKDKSRRDYYDTINDLEIVSENQRRREKPKIGLGGVFFYIVSLFVAVIVCIIAFSVMFLFLSSKNDNNNEFIGDTHTIEPESTLYLNSSTQLTSIVIDIEGNDIVFFDFSSGDSLSLSLSDASVLRDKFGEDMPAAYFKIGDIVDVVYTNEKIITSLKASSLAFERSMITGIRNDTEAKILTIGNDRYTYTDDTIVINNNEQSDISKLLKLSTMDVVSIKGLKNQIWYVEFVREYSSITINNVDKIKNGMLEIDSNVPIPLEEGLNIDVAGGIHNLRVTGDNIDPFILNNVNIDKNGYILDLNEVSVKKGLLVFTGAEVDFDVKINGEIVNHNEPIDLPYGGYNITVTKEGYEDYIQDIVMDKDLIELNINLTKIKQYSKLIITTRPLDKVDIYLDGKLAGNTYAEFMVLVGDHVIEVKKPGYKNEVLNYVVKPDEDNYINISPGLEDTLKDEPYRTPRDDELIQDDDLAGGDF